MLKNILHLVKRFFASFSPFPPSSVDTAWVEGFLNQKEFALWQKMGKADRRHSVAVARAVFSAFAEDTNNEILAAALLHDCGKVVSNLDPFSRALATLFWLCVDDKKSAEWLQQAPQKKKPNVLLTKLALYRQHPKLGAELLAAADAHPLTVSWAAEHHSPAATWTIPLEIGRVLKDCDDD